MTQTNTPSKNPNDAAGAQSTADKKAAASCPLNAPYLQLIPVRYAYVENLAYYKSFIDKNQKSSTNIADLFNNTVQGASYYQEGEQSTHPVGIRLVRDGWLYIVAPHINRIYEHRLQDGIITERTFKGKLIGEIIRESYQEIEQESNKAQQLIFKKGQKIYVSYSQVQWADEKCNQMLKADERKRFMQEIDLQNLSCEHIGSHLLTREQAEKYIAEVAETYQAPDYQARFSEEKEAYSWTCSEFAPCSIGKLTANLRKEYEQKGNYLFMIVQDPIGQMLDLAQEQKLISKWLGDWGEQNQDGLKYQIGSYIESTMTITAQNAQAKGETPWMSKLSADKKQAIYDYANKKNEFDIKAKDNFSEYYSFQKEYINSQKNQNYYNAEKEVADKKAKMISLIGRQDYQLHQTEIDSMVNKQKDYLSTKLNTRGLDTLVNTEEMKAYLEQQRPRYNRWQQRLDKVTSALTDLYTGYFHMNTWYFSLFQRVDLLKLENTIIQDLFRNDEATQKISKFLDEKPYYTWPAIQTNFTVYFLNNNIPVLTKLMDDSDTYVQITTNGDPTAVQKFESAIGKNYWKELISHSDNTLTDLEKIRTLALSNPINYSLNRFIREITGPAISESKLANFNRAIDRYVELSKQLSPSARASFLLEIQRVGYVYLSESEGATGRTSQTLNTINRNLVKLETNKTQLARAIREREQFKNPTSAASRMLGHPSLCEREINRLTREIERLQREGVAIQEMIETNQTRLAELISPLQEGEGRASIRFTLNAEQQAALAFEREALSKGAARLYGQTNAKTLAAVGKSAMLPTFLAVYSLYNLAVEWGKYQKDKVYGTQDALGLTNSALSVGASVLSLWQVAHVTLLNEVVSRVNSISSSIQGARLLAKIGKANILLGASAQLLNGAYSTVSLFSNYERWRDGVLSGNTGLAVGSLTAAAGTLGNAGIGGYALRHSAYTGYQVLTELRAGKTAAQLVWAGKGAIFATNIARATPWGLFFTALQLTGEFIYNLYNLDEMQQWLSHSCWGKDNQNWNQQQHNQHLAEALLKPVLMDKGVHKGTNGVPYRVIQAIFPGLLRAHFASHPIHWQAQWQENNGFGNGMDTTIGVTLAQHTTLLDSEVVALEWRLPWLDQAYFSRQNKNTLNLRLFYTPDLATNFLYGGDGIGYEIPLVLWDQDPHYEIRQVKGDKVKVNLQAPYIVYKG